MPKKSHCWYQDVENKWVKSLPFSETNSAELLAWVKAQPLGGGRETAWIFDLDSTLFCLAPRIHNIFFEFIRAHPRPKKEWEQLVSVLDPSHQKYSIEETFRDLLRRLLSDDREAAEMAAELWGEFFPFWREHFFEDRHIHHDVPYPGAADFVKSVKSLGRKIIYLTGRDRVGSGQGTRHHLKHSGFDLSDAELLLMKPRRHDSDVEFKKKVAELLRAQFHIEGVLDNEPENLVMFAKEFRDAKIVLYHSVMSGRVPKDNILHYLGERKLQKISSFLF